MRKTKTGIKLLIDTFVLVNAGFSSHSSVYSVYNSSSTCELDQLNVTIPNDVGVATNASEYFLFGIFNASISLGLDGTALSGFMSWSPTFKVWNNVTSSSIPTATATKTATVTASPTTSASSTSAPMTTTTTVTNKSTSAELSTGGKAGIGVGASVGGVFIGILLARAWLWNRRKKNLPKTKSPKMIESGTSPENIDQNFALQQPEHRDKLKDNNQTYIHEMTTSNQTFELGA
jgi:hypothetical protein